MPRNELLLMWAVLAQVLLTVVVYLVLLQRKRRAFAAGTVDRARQALHADAWPEPVQQVNNNLRNQFELPVLFYVLIAIALPLRRADLFIVLMSWVFVVTRFAHAGVFVSSNDVRPRSLAWFAGVLVLAAMWLYFALKLLLLI